MGTKEILKVEAFPLYKGKCYGSIFGASTTDTKTYEECIKSQEALVILLGMITIDICMDKD